MANPGGVNLTHEAMQQQATRLGAAKNALEEKLNEVKVQVDELVQAGFSTESASESFRQHVETWTNAARTTVSELDAMSQYLGKASQAFKDVDQQFTVRL